MKLHPVKLLFLQILVAVVVLAIWHIGATVPIGGDYLLRLLGDKAWWLPRWLDRIIPNVDVEGSALERHHPVAPATPAPSGATGPLDETAEEASPAGRHRA